MRSTHNWKNRRGICALVAALALWCPPSAWAAGVAFATGDVLVGVQPGTIRHFTPTGVLIDTSTSGGSSFITGMAFDASGNLYATAFDAQAVYKFDNKGNLLGTFGGGYNMDPESVVFDMNGNAYVGQADGSHQILKFGPTGGLIGSFSPQVQDRGTDWVDLASDQCTMLYTSEGTNVKRFNVCTNMQLADFTTGLSGPCYAHRIRPNFEVLVACTSLVYRLNSSGAVMQTYPLAGAQVLFALNLDPDNKTFWTGDLSSGAVFHVDIATGTVLTKFSAGNGVAGLTVVGEITGGVNAPPVTTSFYVKTTKAATLQQMGHDLAISQIGFGVSQDSVVALLFGQPTFSGGLYGASGFSATPVPISQIADLVEDFASGYYNALGSNKNLHVRIVIATSNHGRKVTNLHGQAWATLVDDVAAWVILQGYAGQVDIAGGIDMEPAWNNAAVTRAWVDGYASDFPQRFLYDVGDAAGCPGPDGRVTTATPGACAGPPGDKPWTQEDVWYVSWGANPSEPLPEIYTTSGSMATEWANLSLYAALAHNASMIIAGAFTEYGQCQQNLGTKFACPASIQNTPAGGWQQLDNKLNVNADPRIAQTLAWSTDIQTSSH